MQTAAPKTKRSCSRCAVGERLTSLDRLALSLLGILIHFTHSNISLFSFKEGVDLFNGSTTLRYYVHTLFKRSLTGTLWLRSSANYSLVSLALEMTRLVSLLLARAQHSAPGELTITHRRFNHKSQEQCRDVGKSQETRWQWGNLGAL